jgi:hypothetical protein
LSVVGTKQTSLVFSTPWPVWKNKSLACIRYRCLWPITQYYNLWLDCRNDKSTNNKIELIDESPYHMKGSFPGPQDTPYEGGHFEMVRIRGVAWSLMLRQ